MNAPELSLDAAMRTEVIDGLLGKLHEQYVFPAVARAVEALIQARQAQGEYDALTTGPALAARVTADLYEASRDKHLRLRYEAEPQPPPTAGTGRPAWYEAFCQEIALHNFGFARVECLPGNVGYLDLRSFAPPEIAAETAVAAMAFLAHTSALIVDVRRNGGGSPEMVALVCTYFFDTALVHLNSLYWRSTDFAQQFWTLPYVPGQRYLDKPVYVLTGEATFSGAEEFTYNLQNLKRATIVGATTRGGANPGDWFPLTAHFEAFIPTGRAINPVSATSWEGTGVTPDIPVPQEQAFDTAYALALKHVLAAAGANPPHPLRALCDEARQALAGVEGQESVSYNAIPRAPRNYA